MSDLLREAHRRAIAPSFRSLADDEIEEKPGLGSGPESGPDIVTVADTACEALLADALPSIVDGPVVGEEAAAADPGLLGLIATEPAVWLVDPIDGTANFAAGSPDYAVMVALCERGRTTAAWILQPEHDVLAVAQLGGGTTVNGVPVAAQDPGGDPSTWSGVVKDRFLPPELVPTVEAGAAELGPRRSIGACAGLEYPGLLAGSVDFLFYWRTLPWDHAPGVLLATEAGLVAHRPDGRPFRPGQPGSGLVVGTEPVVERARRLLVGDDVNRRR